MSTPASPAARPVARRNSRGRTVIVAVAMLSVVGPIGAYGTAAAQAKAVNPAAGVGTVFDRGLGLEKWATQNIAPGVRVSTVTITNSNSAPFWTVTLEQPVTSKVTHGPADAEIGSASWAQSTATQLAARGFQARIEAVTWPGYSDTAHGLMGYRVRVGEFATQAAAAQQQSAIAAAGFTAITAWTGYDAQAPANLENIHVAVIDSRVFRGTVEATHDGNLAQRLTTSSVAAQLGSLVGINGGFFVTSSTDGVQGTQSGLSVYNGQLESMSSGDRAALLIEDGGQHYQVANLTSTASVRSGTSVYSIQGVNRLPGIIRNCGRPGATPTVHPEQDVDCFDANDLVMFTPDFAAALPTGNGTQAVLDNSGTVVSIGARGGSIAADTTVLQGTGTAAAWLDAHAVVGWQLTVDESVLNASNGRALHLSKGDSIVSAAPMLVRDGRIDIDAATEGVVDPQDLSFNYQWANDRQPRTIAGVDAKGDLILVTVDGRLSGGSEGFTLYEEAEFMRSLGAEQALNLDGGGSTAMAVNGELVNHTSDATGERPVGDTIQVLP